MTASYSWMPEVRLGGSIRKQEELLTEFSLVNTVRNPLLNKNE